MFKYILLFSCLFFIPIPSVYSADHRVSIYNPETDALITTITIEPYKIETDFASYYQSIESTVQKISEQFHKIGVLDKIHHDGTIIKGSPEITVDEQAFIDEIIQKSLSGGKVEVPIKTRNSGYRNEDISSLHEVVIATYTTYYNSQKIGRSKNIELSAASIDNIIVGSGDTFSFNVMVGPREIEFGYQIAPEIVNGKIVEGVGGGICQTSSTLFNAVDQLKVKTIERHHHSRDIGYVPKGRDATVSFNGLDYRFQNTTGIPFLIKTYANHGSLTITITTSTEYAELLRHELAE